MGCIVFRSVFQCVVVCVAGRVTECCSVVFVAQEAYTIRALAVRCRVQGVLQGVLPGVLQGVLQCCLCCTRDLHNEGTFRKEPEYFKETTDRGHPIAH